MNFFNICTEEEADTLYAFKDPDICKAIDELRLTKSEEELIPYLWTFSKSERAYNDDIYYAGKAGEARGEARGRREGEARGRAQATLKLLTINVPDCPAHFLKRVTTSTNLSWLDRVFSAAIKCSTWAELQACLKR